MLVIISVAPVESSFNSQSRQVYTCGLPVMLSKLEADSVTDTDSMGDGPIRDPLDGGNPHVRYNVAVGTENTGIDDAVTGVTLQLVIAAGLGVLYEADVVHVAQTLKSRPESGFAP